MAVSCAEVSIPSASPLTIMTPFMTRVFTISFAALRPSGDAFLEPITAHLELGNGIVRFPETKIIFGHIFFLFHLVDLKVLPACNLNLLFLFASPSIFRESWLLIHLHYKFITLSREILFQDQH